MLLPAVPRWGLQPVSTRRAAALDAVLATLPPPLLLLELLRHATHNQLCQGKLRPA